MVRKIAEKTTPLYSILLERDSFFVVNKKTVKRGFIMYG
jgi:hypothetical protein